MWLNVVLSYLEDYFKSLFMSKIIIDIEIQKIFKYMDTFDKEIK